MDRVHVFFAVLLNLFSVQLTFCGTGEPLMFVPPSSFEMRSMSTPFIQAQFHPATGTIQQGIMIPPEHLMPQERMTPEELFLQMMPQERYVPPENIMVPSERMMPLGSMVSEQRIPHDQMASQQNMPHQQQHQDHVHREHMEFQQNMLSPKMSQESIDPQMPHRDRMESQKTVQKIIHTSPEQHPTQHNGQKFTNDATNDLSRIEEDRAVKTGYEYPSHPHPYPPSPSYGYSSPTPSYSAHAPTSPSYSSAAPTYSPPAAPTYSSPTHSELEDKFLLKPDLTDLIKPVTGKMAGKLNGLVGLVLSLLGSGKGLELSGLKDLLIDGILKPLLVAKGGLKALISKLSIPIISLLLINLEVLITIWWLWEECPAPVIVKHDVGYSKPAAPYPATSYNYR